MVFKIELIEFEDHGQEILQWVLKDGVVIGSKPDQAHRWEGAKLLHAEVGEQPVIDHKGVVMRIKCTVALIDVKVGEALISKPVLH